METPAKSTRQRFCSHTGASQLTYVEAVLSQQKEDFISACQGALHYYGGVHGAIAGSSCITHCFTLRQGCRGYSHPIFRGVKQILILLMNPAYEYNFSHGVCF